MHVACLGCIHYKYCKWAGGGGGGGGGWGGGGAEDILKGAQLFHIPHIIRHFFDITLLRLKKTILQAPMPLRDKES